MPFAHHFGASLPALGDDVQCQQVAIDPMVATVLRSLILRTGLRLHGWSTFGWTVDRGEWLKWSGRTVGPRGA